MLPDRIGVLHSMKRMGRPLMTCLILLAAVQAAAAQAITPEAGTPLRKAVLDGLRPMIEAEVGAPVEFVVVKMRVLDGWAFVMVVPQRPGGGAIDYSVTRYSEVAKTDAFDEQAIALLRVSPSGWLVYQYVLGATDVPWLEWKLYYPVPRDVFP